MNGASPEFLSGWKDIARYLGKGVRTVQRYERELRLPVRRPAGKTRGSVLATRAELDAWVSARPIREEFELGQSARNTPASTLASLREALANSRQLQAEMLELRQELRTSVETLHSTLRFICGVRDEELVYRAKQTFPVRSNGLQSGDARKPPYSHSEVKRDLNSQELIAELKHAIVSKLVPASLVPAWEVNAENEWRPRRESNPQPSDPKSDALSN